MGNGWWGCRSFDAFIEALLKSVGLVLSSKKSPTQTKPYNKRPKTSAPPPPLSPLADRFVNDVFSPTQQPTVGVDFFLKEVALEGDRGEPFSPQAEAVRVQLWDIAGQDRAKKINRVSTGARTGHGNVFTYSTSSYGNSLAQLFWRWEGSGRRR